MARLNKHAPLIRILQFLIGVLLTTSSIAKALDISGFAAVLQTYQAFPDLALFPLALSITTLELSLGLWILYGKNLGLSAAIAAFINVGYAMWMAVTLLRGLELTNCGCFGVYFPRPLTWLSPIEDLIFAGMCFGLSHLATKAKLNSLDHNVN